MIFDVLRSMRTKQLTLPTFESLLRQPQIAEAYISQKIKHLRTLKLYDWVWSEYERESQVDPDKAYPSQGLLRTPYDSDRCKEAKVTTLDQELIQVTLRTQLYYLELLNHPERLKALLRINRQPFSAPKVQRAQPIFVQAEIEHHALSINELALRAQGADRPRASRTQRLVEGPFVKLGLQARSILCGSANPECWGSAAAQATMAQVHSLVGVPRDGLFNDTQRQVDLARKAFEWLEKSPVLVGRDPSEQQQLLTLWRHNLMGVLEPEATKALPRAEALYSAGIRTFRVYSPEPGTDLAWTVTKLRQLQRKNNWEEIEIFAGQVISVEQAVAIQDRGANGIYIGIGGGGRCITGVRSGLAIDWPQLVEQLRGQLHVPIIVEGGASDAIAQTLAVGATGIGVTRSVSGGSIESPGGWSFLQDHKSLFKPYGGEASARVKYMGGRGGPFGIIQYIEGQTTEANITHDRVTVPTLLHNYYLLNGDAILSLVFQNARDIPEFQQIAFNSLVKVSPMELDLRHTH
jgi:hypothetical protein